MWQPVLLQFDSKSFFFLFYYCGMRGLNKWKIHIGLMNTNRNRRDTMVFCVFVYVCSELNRVSTTFTSVSGCFFFYSFEKPIKVDLSLLVNMRTNSKNPWKIVEVNALGSFFFQYSTSCDSIRYNASFECIKNFELFLFLFLFCLTRCHRLTETRDKV